MTCECLVALVSKCSGIILSGVGCVMSFFPRFPYGIPFTIATTVIPIFYQMLTLDLEDFKPTTPGALKAGIGGLAIQPWRKALNVISFTSCVDLGSDLLE